ncbi:FAD-dependent monooxygenase [Puniceibacterium sediminis]|uniref:Salicylate hydroxylase n=1 Tax=Puniceibacterium sediminis TaxID=1608407 RepID=A0A238V1M1_9RHOB|nr:FAD-dependent monooxygenase [Puniceibacterium sediminis]SNR28166.1 salicylate hydroxylase [Puniceibacterium sediminis]
MGLQGQKIAVIGGGIGGLAAALALRQRGADVVVLEQAGEISEVGAGLQISPNGLRVLKALGLSLGGSVVRAEAVSLRDYRRGNEVLRLDLARLDGGQAYHFVHRADLIAQLLAAVRAAGVEIRLSQQVVKVRQGARPMAVLANGETCAADLIVGADGVRSVARGVLNGEAPAVFTGQVAWRAVVANSCDHPPEARVHMGPGRHLVSYPLRGGAFVNLVAVEERKSWAAEGWNHRDDPEHLRAAFAGFGGDVPGLLAGVDAPGLWGLFRHPVAKFWQGEGLVLLGDAAHPTLPFLAQGANMALEDAWVLAACLDQHGSEQGLSRYQALRRPRVVRVIEAADGNAWKYHLRNPLIRGAAHLALRVAGRLAPGRMVHQFDWLYGFDATKQA